MHDSSRSEPCFDSSKEDFGLGTGSVGPYIHENRELHHKLDQIRRPPYQGAAWMSEMSSNRATSILMDTIEVVPEGYPAEITGYAQPWLALPGDTVDIKVSCTEPEFSHRTVRVIQGVDLPHSPPRHLEEVASIAGGIAKGRYQVARCGSYAEVRDWCPLSLASISEWEATFYFQAHLLKANHHQSLCSTLNPTTSSGFAVIINKHGLVELWLGLGDKVQVISTTFSPQPKRWVGVKLALSPTHVSLHLTPYPFIAEKIPLAFLLDRELSQPSVLNIKSLLFGGSYAETPTITSPRVTNFFNGRIDSPIIRSLKHGTIVQYDFARNMTTDTILDTSGGGRNGRLVNTPTRAVRGYNWDGTEVDWTKAKYGYGAIHFHEDDLDDAAWDTDFSIRIPSDARSGIYAVEVHSTLDRKTSDLITFIVGTSKETASKASEKVALVLPTFTYLAYANDKLGDPNRSSSGTTGAALCDIAPTPTVDSDRNHRRLDLGLSSYDVHNDGSPNVYSSAKRPILNLRPGFVSYGLNRPRHLSGETMMIGYLERVGLPYDVITDHDLHNRGAEALLPYSVVITGGHPEYCSTEVYDAYEHYANRGGNMMYLGGNGFYWVTAFDPHRPWRIEVRRGESGVRSYSMDGGEWTLSLNGQLGGLWRSRGRSSHALFGVAFCSQGRPPGVPYQRTDAGKDAQFRWMFDSLKDDELIGEFGLGGGSSGDEMDSFDVEFGSPLNGVVVATSTGHDDGFAVASECVKYPILATRGTETREVRSDMIYYETNAGGAVFSVGSINWYPSLGWDDYDNTVARVTGNVIREFLRRSSQKR